MVDAVARVRAAFEEAFHRAIVAVDPRMAVSAELESLRLEGPVTLLAIGKAAPAMAQGAIDVLGDGPVSGVVVSHCHPESDAVNTRGPTGLRYLEGGHPIPTLASLEAGRAVMAEAANAVGTLLVLISGGASSLAEVPLQNLTLGELAASYELLLRSGLSIEQTNTVRRHLSAFKNGGLLAASRTPTVTLLVADVGGAEAPTIASGPTLADSSTPADALAVLAEAGILETFPGKVLDILRSPLRTLTPSPDHRWSIVTDGRAAIRAAADYLRSMGYSVEIDRSPLSGDAAEQARLMVSDGRDSVVTLCHGETVVKVSGEFPGGRNQHAALAAAIGLTGQTAAFAALATDGRDGLTDAAGAIVDGQTCERARKLGLDPEQLLEACRSHEALKATGDLIVTGPTGTNVADIWMSWRSGAPSS